MTAVPRCPEPAAGTRLLIRESLGYCLLYPEGYKEVDSAPTHVCLVPEGPIMGCHTTNLLIGVEDAAGASVGDVADQIVADSQATIPGIEIIRTNMIVAGEQAVAMEGLPGVDSSRRVVMVHEGRRYELIFVPWDEAAEDFARIQGLYETVVNSFAFLPITLPSVRVEPRGAGTGSAVVATVEDGDVKVWEQASGQSQTIFDSGDAIRLELSDDGQLVAFVRRSFFAAGGFDRNEQSSLWVIGRDGSNPRELVSVQQLREQVGAAEADSTNFPRLAWIPNTHRLLYSGNTYEAHGYGEGAHTPLKGVYLVDADTLAGAELAAAGTSFHFVPSPDGRLVALVNTTGLAVFEVGTGRQRLEFPAGPVVGDNGWFTNAGVWTQDSSFFVINALTEPGNAASDYDLWRVPADGSPADQLIVFSSGSGSVIFAPDGSAAAILRAASAIGPSVWFIVPLGEDLGPLAVPRDTLDYSRMVWSPGGTAYVFDFENREELHALCPDAVQDTEFCGDPIRLGEQVEWLEWFDHDRFLYVTYNPRRLYLGALDGPAIMLADDPQSFAALAATCRDDAEFVLDVSVPDGTQLAPDTVFRKTWRVRNSGTCSWDASYRFTFLSGDRLSGPRGQPLAGAVQPGEEVDISVMLVAPATAGTYQGQWQLFDPAGTPFGTRPFVVIQVP